MSIAQILMRGFGQGASTLGNMRFQEQEQRRREEAQEQMRLRMVEEQNAGRAALQAEKLADVQRQQEEAGDLARLMGVKVPQGARLTPDGVRLLAEQGRNTRLDKQNAAAMERLAKAGADRRDLGQMNIDARDPLIQAQTRALDALTRVRNDTDPNIRGGGRAPVDPDAALSDEIAKEAMLLMRPQGRDPGMDPARARQEAERRVRSARGLDVAPAERPGQRLMQGIGGGMGGNMGGGPPPLSAEDRARAQSDPAFARWLQSKGYRL
jgi:hypothetical protein